MFTRRRSALILHLVILLVTAGCSGTPTSPQPTQQEWPISIPDEQGIDSTRLDQMMEVIKRLELPIDSVLVIRHGQLVFEAYPNPAFGPDDMHRLYSATKSFTSALIGIAIQKGFIENVEQKVLDFFPEWTIKNLGPRKEELTTHRIPAIC